MQYCECNLPKQTHQVLEILPHFPGTLRKDYCIGKENCSLNFLKVLFRIARKSISFSVSVHDLYLQPTQSSKSCLNFLKKLSQNEADKVTIQDLFETLFQHAAIVGRSSIKYPLPPIETGAHICSFFLIETKRIQFLGTY